MATVFLFLYDVFKKYRLAFFAAVIGIALLAGYVASKLKLEEDISKAMPADEKIAKKKLCRKILWKSFVENKLEKN